MTWTVRLANEAAKQLKKLPPDHQALLRRRLFQGDVKPQWLKPSSLGHSAPWKTNRVEQTDEHTHSQSSVQHPGVLDRCKALCLSETRYPETSDRCAADPSAAFIPTPRTDVPGARSHLRWNPFSICLSCSTRRFAGRSASRGCDSGRGERRRSASSLDLQPGGNGGSSRSHSTGYNLWSIGVYGPCLLDTRVLGSCSVGDALHHLYRSPQALD